MFDMQMVGDLFEAAGLMLIIVGAGYGLLNIMDIK